MSFDSAPYRTLASNGRNWHILQLGDGRVQLDFGPFAVAFYRDSFQLLHGLAEAALKAPLILGCIAHAGFARSIWFDPQQGALSLAFDGVVLRFLPHELVAFTSLCREAGAELEVKPWLPPSDGRYN
ncbi:MAG: hypothetical protein MI924_35340 [Chloroflexales bacterium]|nr:hypothetical protein [Chloroflexales bacterium]